MSTRELRCPSCDGPMHAVNRREVVIDLCRDCKGVFLDRGELDKLLDVVEAREPVDRPEPARLVRPYRDDDDDDDRYRSHRGERKKKRGGFLAELFEGD